MDHVDLFQPFVMHNHTSGEDNGFVNAIVWVNLDNYHLVKSHPAKIDPNKKWLPKQKIIQNFNINALGFRKTRNENPPHGK